MPKFKKRFQTKAKISINDLKNTSINSLQSQKCYTPSGENTPYPQRFLKNTMRKSAFYVGNFQSPAFQFNAFKMSKTPSKIESKPLILRRKIKNDESNKDNYFGNILNLKVKKSKINEDSCSISNVSENSNENNNDNYYVNFLNNLYKDDEHLNKKISNKKQNQFTKYCFMKNVPSMNLIINNNINNNKVEKTNKNEKVNKMPTGSERNLSNSPELNRRNSRFLELKNDYKNLIGENHNVNNNINKNKTTPKKSSSNVNLYKDDNLKDVNLIKKVKTRKSSIYKVNNRGIKSRRNSQTMCVKKLKKLKLAGDSSPGSKRSNNSNKEKKPKENNDKKNKNKTVKIKKVKRWFKALCCFVGKEEE